MKASVVGGNLMDTRTFCRGPPSTDFFYVNKL